MLKCVQEQKSELICIDKTDREFCTKSVLILKVYETLKINKIDQSNVN